MLPRLTCMLGMGYPADVRPGWQTVCVCVCRALPALADRQLLQGPTWLGATTLAGAPRKQCMR